MANICKAEPHEMGIAGIPVRCYYLEDDFVFGVESVTGAIGKCGISLRIWLHDHHLKGLISVTPIHTEDGLDTKVFTVTPEVAFAYWEYWADLGNERATRLVSGEGLDSCRRRISQAYNSPT